MSTYVVGREKIREYASAIGETAPICHDVEAARAAGAKPALVRTGNGRATEGGGDPKLKGVPVYDDLAAFAGALLAS